MKRITIYDDTQEKPRRHDAFEVSNDQLTKIEEILKPKSNMRHTDKCTYKETGDCVCDGYHTFDELYKHRVALYMALCKFYSAPESNPPLNVWKTKTHSDGTSWDGWFILGIGTEQGEQITYHLPLDKWDECNFAETLRKAPTFDGHTSDDVLKRLKNL